MTTDATALQERIARVLEGQGLTAHPDQYDSNIHGWRCEHPDIYGPCSCFEELVAAVLPIVEAEVRAAVEERESRQVQVHFDPPPPQMVPVRLPCPRCGHR